MQLGRGRAQRRAWGRAVRHSMWSHSMWSPPWTGTLHTGRPMTWKSNWCQIGRHTLTVLLALL